MSAEEAANHIMDTIDGSTDSVQQEQSLDWENNLNDIDSLLNDTQPEEAAQNEQECMQQLEKFFKELENSENAILVPTNSPIEQSITQFPFSNCLWNEPLNQEKEDYLLTCGQPQGTQEFNYLKRQLMGDDSDSGIAAKQPREDESSS